MTVFFEYLQEAHIFLFHRDRLRTGANIASITFGAIFIHVVCKDSLNLASDSGQLDADDSLDEQRNQKDGIVHRKHV